MRWTGDPVDGGDLGKEESMRQAGETRDTGIQHGTNGNPGDWDKDARMSTGMEGRTRTGERMQAGREERNMEKPVREHMGVCGGLWQVCPTTRQRRKKGVDDAQQHVAEIRNRFKALEEQEEQDEWDVMEPDGGTGRDCRK